LESNSKANNKANSMPATTQYQLSTDQESAAIQILEWAKRSVSTGKSDHFTLAGLAGTGKTVLANHVVNSFRNMGFRTSVATPSAKAANVLAKKGVEGVVTLHKLLYRFTGLVEVEELVEQPKFVDEGNWGTDKPNIVVCDESSMIDENVFSSLTSRGVPILFIGDHGQLGPVGKDPGIMQDADIYLEKIHRQAEGSPIITLAHAVRNGEQITSDYACGDTVKIGRASNADVARIFVDKNYDAIVCGTNKTRIAFNNAIRKRLGRSSQIEVGDRVTCRLNDWARNIFNGETFEVVAVNHAKSKTNCVSVDLIGEPCPQFPEGQVVYNAQLYEPALHEAKFLQADMPPNSMKFQYGFAITCHSAQGSTIPRCIYVDEIIRSWDMKRLRYTGITRSADAVAVVLR